MGGAVGAVMCLLCKRDVSSLALERGKFFRLEVSFASLREGGGTANAVTEGAYGRYGVAYG